MSTPPMPDNPSDSPVTTSEESKRNDHAIVSVKITPSTADLLDRVTRKLFACGGTQLPPRALDALQRHQHPGRAFQLTRDAMIRVALTVLEDALDWNMPARPTTQGNDHE